jgi:putative endonuclease
MYFVYVLKSVSYHKSYTGITDNLERRLTQHNAGYHTYTKRWKPWEIVYNEVLNDRDEARSREKYLKSAAGRRWLEKVVFNADVAELVYAQS